MGLLPDTRRIGGGDHTVTITDLHRSITWACTCGLADRVIVLNSFDRRVAYAAARAHITRTNDKEDQT